MENAKWKTAVENDELFDRSSSIYICHFPLSIFHRAAAIRGPHVAPTMTCSSNHRSRMYLIRRM
jgi:hypothetical protein